MSYQTLLFDVEDRIATVTLNRPERMNAYTDAMGEELNAVWQRCDEDDAIRAVVLTGAGRAFCAGADLSSGSENPNVELEKLAPAERERLREERSARAKRWGGYPGPFPHQIRKPVFAAINGHAIGVGITYPMMCDVRFVAEDAKIQFAFVRRGLLSELWSHSILPRVAGLSNAADLLLTGRIVSGRELAAMGLASAALPADQVLAKTRERAREVLRAAPISVALSKRLLWQGLTAPLETIGGEEARLLAWTYRQPDSREGVLSFLEKREPDWKGSVKTGTPD
jgi:enoyl-CoA hydratase/carnithine racemase